MSTYARIIDNVAVEVWTDGGLGIVPADVFVPGLAELFEPVPEGVQAGWSLTDGVWTAPPDPEAVPVVPQIVTMRQARLALLGAGLLDDVETALSGMDGAQGQAAKIEWEYSQEVHRSKPFVQMLGAAIGLTEAQVDELFIAAARID